MTRATPHTPHAVAHGIRATECKHRLPNRRTQRVVLTAFASLRRTPSRGRRTADGWLWRCTSVILLRRSSASSWPRDLGDASYAGCSRAWHHSHGMQAPISKPKAAKLRADGVCLAARHAPTLTAPLQTLGCRCPSGAAAAGRVRVLGSVTFVMLHTPDGVARGIRAAECKPRFAKRRTQGFVLTAFASLLGTRRR